MITATIDDVKLSAKLLDYGDNVHSKQITDAEIDRHLTDITKQVNTWISELGLEGDDNGVYYAKRYIILETIVALSLSNYTDGKKDYIDSLKLERDKLYELIEKNTRRFIGNKKVSKLPSLSDGGLFL